MGHSSLRFLMENGIYYSLDNVLKPKTVQYTQVSLTGVGIHKIHEHQDYSQV